MKSTCSRTTTPLSTWRDHKVSYSNTLIRIFSPILSQRKPAGRRWSRRDQGAQGYDARHPEASWTPAIPVPEDPTRQRRRQGCWSRWRRCSQPRWHFRRCRQEEMIYWENWEIEWAGIWERFWSVLLVITRRWQSLDNVAFLILCFLIAMFFIYYFLCSSNNFWFISS